MSIFENIIITKIFIRIKIMINNKIFDKIFNNILIPLTFNFKFDKKL